MSDYTIGAKNVKTLGDLFLVGDVMAGNAAFSAASVTETVAWGGSGTPDFFLVMKHLDTDGNIEVSADSTTITFIREASTVIENFSYFIGNLS